MAASRGKMPGRVAALTRNGFPACRCGDCDTRGARRARKRTEAREVAADVDEELGRRMQELLDGHATHGPCAHCGRNPAAGYARAGDAVVCHPHDPGLPDCYRRVSVWAERLGALRGRDPMPAGLDGVSDAADAFLRMVTLTEELDLYGE
jgi:hypothetical protein